MDNRVKELLEKVRSTAGAVGSMAGNTARQAGKYAGELFISCDSILETSCLFK